ncbi:juvenile hormone acid O-methyltransferase-like [Onthophagus taurus]|uniref:juvenile hormone acid O-methyltransferase-like n=1 Tax=Onthophagus taurus TaxID=166361 RepID=UPI0039BE765E
MYDPKLYRETKSLFAKSHIEKIINCYSTLLNWNQNENILEVGCGDGSITIEVLVDLISKNVSNFNYLATDLLQPMINLATNDYFHERVQFKQADILDEKLWLNNKECFMKIFSILCLMVVPNPTIWVKNIYNVLKQNGQIVLILISTSPMIKQHISLSQQEKWSKYQKSNFFLSDYLLSDNPTSWINQHLRNGGFKDIEQYEIVYDTTLKDFKSTYQFVKAFTSLNENIPEELKGEYLNEMCANIEKEVLNDEKYSYISYDVIIARK